jgi:hypothetical protein
MTLPCDRLSFNNIALHVQGEFAVDAHSGGGLSAPAVTLLGVWGAMLVLMALGHGRPFGFLSLSKEERRTHARLDKVLKPKLRDA